jgi:ABC-type uncharacterized transport system YnjBCD ATPase subunit
MGPSGSGKTTLLDVLAGRKTVGTTTGTLLFSGQKPSRAFLRRFTGYVEQFDTLLGILTVEEMLLYTAEMKRPISESLASKKDAVEEVLHCLALTSCRDVKIGNPLTKGISGGQAKRVNIGIAIITNPRVLFLDGATHTRACGLRVAPAPGRAARACTHACTPCTMHTHALTPACLHATCPCASASRRADVRAGQLHGERDHDGRQRPCDRRRDGLRYDPQPHSVRVRAVRQPHDAHARPRGVLWRRGSSGD